MLNIVHQFSIWEGQWTDFQVELAMRYACEAQTSRVNDLRLFFLLSLRRLNSLLNQPLTAMSSRAHGEVK